MKISEVEKEFYSMGLDVDCSMVATTGDRMITDEQLKELAEIHKENKDFIYLIRICLEQNKKIEEQKKGAEARYSLVKELREQVQLLMNKNKELEPAAFAFTLSQYSDRDPMRNEIYRLMKDAQERQKEIFELTSTIDVLKIRLMGNDNKTKS